MTIRQWRPSAELLSFVRAYSVRVAGLGASSAYVPLPARRDCFLEFYIQGRYRVVTVATGAEHWAPQCVLVGPSTHRREDLKLSGSLQVFSIRFTPIGFRALFGIPTRLLCDHAVEAEQVLGREIVELYEQLAAAPSALWRSIADKYLLKHLCMHQISAASRMAGQAAADMQRSQGIVRIAEVAARLTVSARQLERAFQEQVGVSPKVFGKLLRLDHALRLAGRESNWAEIASACGYFDQSHMVQDFRAMVGATPVEFAALRDASPPV